MRWVFLKFLKKSINLSKKAIPHLEYKRQYYPTELGTVSNSKDTGQQLGTVDCSKDTGQQQGTVGSSKDTAFKSAAFLISSPGKILSAIIL